MLKVLILDDELDACSNIDYFLKKHFHTKFSLIASAQSSVQAEELMANNSFDLFFIDIEMPYESGIDFALRKGSLIKSLIFVTAYHQYAVTAFRLHAIDYILKPIDEQVFVDALSRYFKENYIIRKGEIEKIASDINSNNIIDTLVLRDKHQAERVPIKDIILLEGDKSYSKIIYKGNPTNKSFLASRNLSHYEEVLENYNFIRVHKSFLINKEAIFKFDFANSTLYLHHNISVPVSRRKQSILMRYI